MLVSVIIPTYNREKTLLRAIESVTTQEGVEWELWIIDDGSTDETSTLVQNYIDSHSQFSIHYHYLPNSGVSSARNVGISLSDSKYVAFLDSDDEWMPGKLRQQVEYLEKNPECPLVHSDEIWIRDGVRVNQKNKHKKEGGDLFIRSLKLCLISPSAVMLRRNVFDTMGTFDTAMTVCEDYDLWLRITSQMSVGFISTPLIYKYGGHKDQLSQKYFAMDYWRVKSIDRLLNTFELPASKREEAVKVLLKKCSVLLKGYLKHDNMVNYEEIDLIYRFYSGKKFHT